jgi:hypothetical protein
MRRSLLVGLLLGGLSVSACDCGGGDNIRDVSAKLTFSAEAIDFGEVPVGDFRYRGLTIKNEGLLAAKITRFALDFPTGEVTFDAAPTDLPPGASFDVVFAYAPVDLGEDRGTLRLEADDGKGERTITVRGVGIRGAIAVDAGPDRCGDTPDSLSFGEVAPGGMVTRTIKISSSGSAAIRILSAVREVGTTSEFDVTGVPEGGATIQPGGELTLTATYRPVDGGRDEGAFIVTTDLLDRPSIRVAVCGESVAPALCARPTPVDFGAVASGARATRTLRLESCGRLPLELQAAALTPANDPVRPTDAGFSVLTPPALPRTLMPGESIDVDLEFAPTTIASAAGFLRVDSNAVGNTQAFVALLGRGGQPCAISIAPMALSFSGVAAGASQTKSVLVANDGASACTIDRVAIATGGPEFTLAMGTRAAPFVIGPGASETVQIVYAPGQAAGPHTGALEVVGNGSTFTVPLTGNEPLPAGCQLEVVPAIANFGAVAPGTVRTLAIDVNNVSDEFCRVSRVTLAGGTDPAFANTGGSFGVILPGRSRQYSVTYTPTRPGSARGEIVFTTSDVDSPEFRVPLVAAAAQTGICVEPRVLPFGDSPGVATQLFTIYACGGAPVTVTGLDWTTADPEFALQAPPALPFTLQAGQRQTVSVTYTPRDRMGDLAVLTVRSNDPVNPALTVDMTGGPEIVPTSAGRYLYYWQIPSRISPAGGDVMRLPLQGVTTAASFWGPRSGKNCTGCHYVSPDGRYVALIEFGSNVSFKIIDTQQSVALRLPPELNRQGVSYISWRPNVNTQPPYQFAFDAPGSVNSQKTSIHLGSVFGGYLGEVPGTADATYSLKMPSWGPNGQIAAARGAMENTTQGGAGGFAGVVDVVVFPETGGVVRPVPGASNNNAANYYPAISPNGRWIAFTQSQSAMSTIAAADAQIRMVPADLSGMMRNLATLNGADGASSLPLWSLDGSFISFSSNRAGGVGDWDVYVGPIDPMTGADSAARNVTQANTTGFEHSAQWSP